MKTQESRSEHEREEDLKKRIVVVPRNYEVLQDGGPPAKPHKFTSHVVEWDDHPVDGAATAKDAEDKARTLRQNIAAGKDRWR